MHEKIHPTDYQKSFHVYFLMGQPEIPDAELESRIQDELKLGDVIQYDQIDSYRQGSSKHSRYHPDNPEPIDIGYHNICYSKKCIFDPIKCFA